ncbi:nucleotidyltransferase domain-containing protein [Allokutzneria oryzae]|uniref:Nucleotidyltransferase domain-containing protein n=1 Tax=Allokutzneria oryzae TaxID=1378989 RepID=A0ABV6A3L2_9PSEU
MTAPDPAEVSSERATEIDAVIRRVTRWAAEREDITGLLLVGSCARDDQRPGSDVDLVLLAEDTS